MRTVIVEEKYSGKRVDRFLMEKFNNTPHSAFYKAFRQRNIKVNGSRVKENHTLAAGDKVEIYIIDDILDAKPDFSMENLASKLDIVYEDNNLILINKAQGIPVHSDENEDPYILIDMVQAYIHTDIQKPDEFKPALCHRLDRNTGGLVMIAKNQNTLDIMFDKIKDREIRKYYLCMVKGCPSKPQAEIRGYLKKDSEKIKVHISQKREPGALEIITKYKVLRRENDTSLLEVELVTGRTHQIRAHLASIGHPVIGDGKYGNNMYNRTLGARYQALWAYRVVFDFREAGMLSYLKGKEFKVGKVDFKITALPSIIDTRTL